MKKSYTAQVDLIVGQDTDIEYLAKDAISRLEDDKRWCGSNVRTKPVTLTVTVSEGSPCDT